MFPIIKRDFINILINPALLFYNTLFPVVMIIILGAVNANLYDTDLLSAYDYYGVSVLLFMALNIAIVATNSFMEVSIKEANMRIGYTPIKRRTIYFSKILATFIFCMITLTLVMGIVWLLFGINFGGFFGFYLLIAGLSFASCTIGVAVCALLRSEASANQLLGVVNFMFALLGGVFFHPRAISEGFARLSVISPARWVIDATMRMIYDNDISLLLPTMFALSVLTIIFLIIADRAFKLEAYL